MRPGPQTAARELAVGSSRIRRPRAEHLVGEIHNGGEVQILVRVDAADDLFVDARERDMIDSPRITWRYLITWMWTRPRDCADRLAQDREYLIKRAARDVQRREQPYHGVVAPAKLDDQAPFQSGALDRDRRNRVGPA